MSSIILLVKKFFNSVEHEKSCITLGPDIIMLINVKIRTIVSNNSILTFIGSINFMLSRVELIVGKIKSYIYTEREPPSYDIMPQRL